MDSMQPLPKMRSRDRGFSRYHQLEDEKKYRYLFSISVIISIITIINIAQIYHLQMNECVALIMFILVIHFFALFGIVISGFDSLHMMTVKRCQSRVSSTLFIPYGVHKDITKPMDSISAVIGLRGSNSEQISQCIFGSYAALAFVVILTNMLNNPYSADGHNSSDICAMLGIMGGFLLCNFELEHKSALHHHDLVHIIGAALFMFGSLIAYGFQQEFDFFSSFLIITAIIFLSMYGLLKFMDFEDSKCVHYQSMFMIGFEAVAIICSMTANIMQCWNLKYVANQCLN